MQFQEQLFYEAESVAWIEANFKDKQKRLHMTASGFYYGT